MGRGYEGIRGGAGQKGGFKGLTPFVSGCANEIKIYKKINKFKYNRSIELMIFSICPAPMFTIADY